jgi:hypothetical protein
VKGPRRRVERGDDPCGGSGQRGVDGGGQRRVSMKGARPSRERER